MSALKVIHFMMRPVSIVILLSLSFLLHSCMVATDPFNAEPSPVYTAEVLSTTVDGDLPAFPGAAGFGAASKGGRGGQVLFVDNLKDSGEGSLRAAINTPGPRTIIFRTGGTITLQSPLDIREPYITIAGQSAPGDGITIRNDGSFSGDAISIRTHDVILRYLRVRPGPGPKGSNTGDAVAVLGGSDIIIDHCSLSWALDEVLSVWFDANKVTVQWSVISEGLYNSGHRLGDHSRGVLIGEQTERITLYKNLFAHNAQRNPLVNVENEAIFQVTNNVVYNWGAFGAQLGGRGSAALINLERNLFKAGQDSNRTRFEVVVGGNSQLYAEGNIGPRRNNTARSEWSLVGNQSSLQQAAPMRRRASQQFPAPPLPTESARESYDKVLEDVGATLPLRDAIDRRIVQDVARGRGRIIDHPNDVGGWPTLDPGNPLADSDADGMPDIWEGDHDLDPQNPEDRNGDPDGDGYTNLEEFLNATDPGSS